jgi:hypothetical protein
VTDLHDEINARLVELARRSAPYRPEELMLDMESMSRATVDAVLSVDVPDYLVEPAAAARMLLWKILIMRRDNRPLSPVLDTWLGACLERAYGGDRDPFMLGQRKRGQKRGQATKAVNDALRARGTIRIVGAPADPSATAAELLNISTRTLQRRAKRKASPKRDK